MPAVRTVRSDVNRGLDESNYVAGHFVAEVTANDVITVIRPSKLTNRLSNFKVCKITGTNRKFWFGLYSSSQNPFFET